jgi:hypothetical protein
VLAKDESLNNNKVVAFPALTFASTYCLSLYGWKDASYNVSVSGTLFSVNNIGVARHVLTAKHASSNR